ncbi:MAG: outer membrane protein assembly factor BamB [Microvirgula sp.]
MNKPFPLKLSAVALLAALALSGCSLFSGSDNTPEPTPLKPLKPLVDLKVGWKNSVSDAGGYVFEPAFDGERVYAAGNNGRVQIIDPATGREIGGFDTRARLSAGVGVRDGRVFAVSERGELLAFTTQGESRWKATLTSQALEAPQTDGKTVVVRTGDGNVTAFDFASGQQLWLYQRQQPALSVRSTGAMQLLGSDVVLLGLPGGVLTVLGLADGRAMWEANVATPKGATELDRMVDVASRPVFDRGQVCAVAFQGRLSCFDARTATPMWSREVSSSKGIALDAANVYVTADDGSVQAFDRADGRSVWRQDGFKYRKVEAPALLGRFVVVTDGEGIAHLLSNESGDELGRASIGASSQPVAAGPNLLVQGLGRIAQLGL